MTRTLVALAALAFAAAFFAACGEPDPMDDRNCGAWYEQFKCKNAGDACDEVAVQLSADAKTTGGKCKDFNGKLACAPVREAAGACQAVESCTYEPNDPMTCVAKCTFLDGTVGPDKVCAP